MIHTITPAQTQVACSKKSQPVEPVPQAFPQLFPEFAFSQMAQSLVVLDAGVEGYATLAAAVEAQAAVVILNSDQDGVEQLISALSLFSSATQVHIIAHGASGYLELGNSQLKIETLDRYAWDLLVGCSQRPISFFLYGCNVAAGNAGAEFVQRLHHLTGANIAASTTLTGNAAQGGDWNLAYQIGAVEGSLPIAAEVLAAYPGTLAAPVITDLTDITKEIRATGEGTAQTISGISIEDQTGGSYTVTLKADHGIINLAALAGLTVTNDGTGNITLIGALNEINAALNGMTYSPTEIVTVNGKPDAYSGTETIKISVTDSEGLTATRDVTLAITPINDVPTLSLSAATALEGGSVSFTASNFGIVDVDNVDEQVMIKITEIPGKGYLTFNGARLVPGSLFSVADIAGLKYYHDGTQTTASGGLTDSFQFTVDDGAGGTISATAMPINITPVNQRPTVSGGNNALFEGQLDFPVSINITDPDQTGSSYSIQILSLPADGVLKLNGVAVTINQTLSSADLSKLTYSHDGNDANFGNPPDVQFNVKVVDDGGGTGTPGSTTSTITLQIKPNNDDPLLNKNMGLVYNASQDPDGIGVGQDQFTRLITANELHLIDPDSSTSQLTYTLAQATDSTIGQLQLFSGGQWSTLTVGSSFSQNDIDKNRLRYTFQRNQAGTFNDGFKFQVRDSEITEYISGKPGVNREGGIWNASGTALQELTFNITVTAPAGPGGSGAPTIAANAMPTEVIVGQALLTESGSATITKAMLEYADVDSQPDQLVYRVMQTPTSGVIKVDGVAISRFGSFTQQDINDGKVTVQHAGDEDFIDGFKFTVSDGTNVTVEKEFKFDVTPINDAPVVTVKGSPYLAEGGTIGLTNAYFTISDIDGSGEKSGQGFAAINTVTFKVVNLPVSGILQVLRNSSWQTIDANTLLTKAELDGGNLRYTHNGSETIADSFDVQAYDDSGVASSDTSNTATVKIEIAQLNDLPYYNSSKSLEVLEAGTGLIKGSSGKLSNEAHLEYLDPDNSTLQRQFRITKGVANGQLLKNGQALAVGSIFTQKDLDENRITYKHNGSEIQADRFEFQVSDGSGSSVPGAYDILIKPINDAPLLSTPSTQWLLDADTLTFSAANGNRIVVSDPDLLSIQSGEVDILRVTLDVQQAGATFNDAVLTLASGNGITLISQTNGKVVFEGALANVQTALDGLKLKTLTDVDGTLTLQVTVDDRLNGDFHSDPSVIAATGLVVTKPIAINASSANDPAIVTAPTSALANEDGLLLFNGGSGIGQTSKIVISDVDDFGRPMTVEVSIGAGLGSLNAVGAAGNGSNKLTLTGSKDQINTALASLGFTPTANYNGDLSLTVKVLDEGGGIAGSSQAVTITVNPLNDTPLLTTPGTVQVIENDNVPLTFTNGAIKVNDGIDVSLGAADSLTVTVEALKASSGSSYGKLTATNSGSATISGNNTSTLTISGTQAEINSILDTLSYAPDFYNVDEVINLKVTATDADNGAEAVSTSLGKGKSTTVVQNIVVNISGVNDKPVLDAPSSAVVVTEDSSVTLTGAGNLFTVSDLDDFGANNLVATVIVEHGQLSLAGNDGATVTGSNSSTLTIEGTKAQINAALDGLIFTPTVNYHGTAKLDVTINDGGNTGSGGAQTDSKTLFITVNPANDRPTATGTVALGAVTEDDANPASAVISALITSSNYSDTTDDQTANSGGNTKTELSYIAITANSSIVTQGVWQFKNALGDWIDVPVTGLADATALVVRADREIRFKPASDFHGTPGSLSVKLADSSTTISESSIATDTKDLTANGGTSQTGAWSANAVTLTTAVTAVNDAPTITNSTSSANLSATTEDIAAPTGNTVLGLFSAKYRDTADDKSGITGGGNSSTGFGGIAITGNAATAAQGEWQYQLSGSSTWTVIATSGLSDATAILLPTNARLRFLPAPDYNGTPGKLTVRFSDSPVTFASAANLSSTGSTSSWSGSTTTLATVITAVNDAPVLSGSGVTGATYTEQLAAVNVGANLSSISDVEIARGEKLENTLTATVKITDFLAGDQLSFTVGSTGITVTNSNGTYTLSGTGASRANLLQVMQSAVFTSTSDNPTNYDTDTDRTIAFQVNDNSGPNNLSNAINTTISIVGVNDTPDAISDTNAILEGAIGLTGDVRANDLDPDNQINTLIISAVNGKASDVNKTLTGKYGTVIIKPDGSYTYSLDNSNPLVQKLGVGNSLTDEQFDYTISDGSLTDSATLTITITGTNDIPVAQADTNSIFEDETAPAMGNVLTNDSDIDQGDLLSVSMVNGSAGNLNKAVVGKYGSLLLQSDGSYSYSINNANSAVQALGVGQSLSDEVFTYQVSDSKGGTASTTLTITINGTNDAPTAIADTKSATVGQPAATGNLLGNDSDVDNGDLLSVTQINFGGNSKPLGTAFNSQYGSLTVNANGTYSYTADASHPTVIALGQGQSLTETFTYTISDGKGGTNTATLTLTVGGINDTPTAQLDSSSIFEDASGAAIGNALNNDSDPDGDSLTVTAVNGTAANLSQPVAGLYGSLTLNANGTYSYSVNNANSTVQGLGIGEAITDSFTYLISDGHGGSSMANIVITINGTNDIPVAVADINSISEDALNPATGNVLPNDTDTDQNDLLTVSAVNGAAANLGNAVNGSYGSLTLNANGSYSYVLDSSKAAVQALGVGDSLTETFTYNTSDGKSSSSSTTLTLIINGTNDGNTAIADSHSIAEDALDPATGNVITGTSGAGKDLDPDQNDVLQVSQVNEIAGNVGNIFNGSYGSLTLNASGDYSYSINNANPRVQELSVGETLTETFTYQISDGKGGSSSTTLTITISGSNDAPIAILDSDSVTDGVLTPATGNLLSNDTDVDQNDILTVTQLNGSAANLDKSVAGTYGSIILNASGSYTYSLDHSSPLVQALGVGETALETFTYQIADGQGGFSTAQIQITVNGSNDGPTAVADLNSIFEDALSATTGSVIVGATGGAGKDSDPDNNDVLTVAQVNGLAANVGSALSGSYGSLTLNANGSYSYSVDNSNPQVQALGVGKTLTEAFSYQISDGKGGSSGTSLTITINGTNDAPIANANINSVTEDLVSPAQGNVLTNDRDLDGDLLSVLAVEFNGTNGSLGSPLAGSYGNLTLNADGSYSYVLDSGKAAVQELGLGESLTETFTYSITDPHGGTAQTTLTITVNGRNDGPVAVADTNQIFEDATSAATGNVIDGMSGVGKDLDADKNDMLNVTLVNGSATHLGQTVSGIYGNLVLNADGSYSYAVDNSHSAVQELAVGESLTDRFTYQISDGKDGFSDTTLTLTINGTNDAPVAAANTNSVTEDLITAAQGNVLGNDRDVDGDLLSVSGLTVENTPAAVGQTVTTRYGSLRLNADGTYSFTVDSSNPAVQALGINATLSEVFTYEISDPFGGKSTATLTITIGGTNDGPVAVADTNRITEEALNPAIGNVITDALTSDSDLDGDSLSVVQVNGEANNVGNTLNSSYGSLTLNADGSYSYQLDNSNSTVQALSVGETLTETFIYQISDGNGGFSDTTLTISIDGANDAPVAVVDLNSITEDIATPAQGNVLLNDQDIDGDLLSVVQVNGDASKVGNALNSSYGSLTLNADGSYSYRLDNSNAAVQTLGRNETLTETFTYQISDGNGGLSETTLTITINGSNDDVIAIADTNVINEDDLQPVTGTVLTNDIDIEGDSISVTQVNGEATNVGNLLSGLYSSITLAADGSYSYSLDNSNPLVQALAVGETLSDRFTYQISDGGSTSTTTLTITINGTNDLPVAAADLGFVAEDAVSSVLGDVLFNDQDPDASDRLTVSAVNNDPNAAGNAVLGQYGSLTLNADGSYSYRVDRSQPEVAQLLPGMQLTESFKYQITDGHGAFSEATLTLTIGENDAPLSRDQVLTVTEDQPYVFTTGDFAFSDPDYGDSLSAVRIDSLPVNGKLTLDGQPLASGQVIMLTDLQDGKLSFAADPDANGDAYAQFSFSVQDSSGATNSFAFAPSRITINVLPINDAPVLDLDNNDSSVKGTGYSTLFAPNSPVAIADLDTQVTDIDSSNIQSATITLTNRPNGSSEFLTVLSSLPAGITASAYDSTTGEIKLSGSGTLADYQTAIAAIGYGNSSNLRNTSTREVTVVVNDGELNSNFAKTQIFYDTDNDGIADIKDLDADNDGIPDLIELGDQPNRDTDGDGLIDSLDLDSDNDGLPDLEEAGFSSSLLKVIDANGDGVIDLTSSFGKNGLTDRLESFPDSGLLTQKPVDTDRDGLPDFQDLDSDNDGAFDLTESGRGFPDRNRDGRVDDPDSDGDGIPDAADGIGKFGGAPRNRLTDSNNNGIPDYLEIGRQRPGGSGSDTISGTDGDDILSGFSDLDIIDGRGGNDTIMGGSDRDRLYGGEGNDTIMGGSNDDSIEGNAGDDILNGGSGNDLIYGGSGNDQINAGEGNDFVFGEAGNDRITGNEGNDKLDGSDGSDLLIGGRGNDLLVGGRGKDKMTGGQGRDKFVYSSVTEFGDKITDFEIVKDRFDLSDLLKGGSMSDVQFKQKGRDTLVQVNAGKGFQTLATLQNVEASTMGNRHFDF